MPKPAPLLLSLFVAGCATSPKTVPRPVTPLHPCILDEAPKTEPFEHNPALWSALPGLRLSKAQSYGGAQLYGRINGGAELYLEFGFQRLTQWSAEGFNVPLTINVYRMKTAAAAYGVYSLSVGSCQTPLAGHRPSCLTAHRIVFTKGPYLVDVLFFNGDDKSQKTGLRLANHLLATIKARPWNVPEPMAQSKNLRYLSGPVALNASAPRWSSRLTNIPRFHLFEGSTEGRKGDDASSALVCFESDRQVQHFMRNIGLAAPPARDGSWVLTTQIKGPHALRNLGDRRYLLLEAGSEAALRRAQARF